MKISSNARVEVNKAKIWWIGLLAVFLSNWAETGVVLDHLKLGPAQLATSVC
jgi:hypothetical protein